MFKVVGLLNLEEKLERSEAARRGTVARPEPLTVGKELSDCDSSFVLSIRV
jgi:hypothetical protein